MSTLCIKWVCLELSIIVIQTIYLAILSFPEKKVLYLNLTQDSIYWSNVQFSKFFKKNVYTLFKENILKKKSKRCERVFVKLNTLSIFFNSLTWDVDKNSRTFLK